MYESKKIQWHQCELSPRWNSNNSNRIEKGLTFSVVRKFPHLVDVPATASLVDTHENGLPRVVQSPSAPSGAVTPGAFLKLIPHFGEPWSRGLRKQRWLPGFVAFLSWHSICWLQTISWLPWSSKAQTDIHPLILAHLLTAASPRKIGLLSHFHWSETIPREKSDAGFLRTWSGEEERGWWEQHLFWGERWQNALELIVMRVTQWRMCWKLLNCIL